MDAHVLTIDDATLDKLINTYKYQYTWQRQPVGFKVENASTSPAVKRIDRDGNEFTPSADFFWNHELFIMPKCLLSSAGVATYSNDRIGTGLDFTGAAGDAMVWCNNAQYKYLYESDSDTQFYWYAPYDSNYRGFEYHPHCYAGGGTKHDHFYLAAYEASLGVDASGNKILRSITGAQPWTGGEIRSLAFTSGGPTAFTTGEQLTGAVSGATGYIVSFYVSSGTWASGDAAGTVYLMSTATAFQSESINGSVSGADCATASAAATALPLTLDNALTYAANKGAGWTIEDIYCRGLLQGLFYTQFGTRNSQTAIGLGVVNLESGVGFAGKMTGADDIDTRGDAFGTGTGSGTAGLTPIKWNNLENWFGGNVYEFVAGINIYKDSGSGYVAGEYRLTKPDGTGTIAGTLPAGSDVTGVGTVPLSSGYISTVQRDNLGAITFMPATADDTASGSDKGYCDYAYAPAYNPGILFSGGFWGSGLGAGVGFRSLKNALLTSYRNIGARLKYIPQS